MPAYVLARQRIPDPDADALQRYRAASGPLVERFGGRFIVRGGAIEALEGETDVDRIVIIEFAGAAQARAWFDSPEYQEIAPLRRSASESQFLLVEGSG